LIWLTSISSGSPCYALIDGSSFRHIELRATFLTPPEIFPLVLELACENLARGPFFFIVRNPPFFLVLTPLGRPGTDCEPGIFLSCLFIFLFFYVCKRSFFFTPLFRFRMTRFFSFTDPPV